VTDASLLKVSGLRAIDATADGLLVLTVDAEGARVWDGERGALFCDVGAGTRSRAAICWGRFDASGERALLGAEDGSAVVVGAADGSVLAKVPAPRGRVPLPEVSAVVRDAEGRVWVSRFDGVVRRYAATGEVEAEWDLQPTARVIDIYEAGVMDLVETPWGVVAADMDGVVLLTRDAPRARVPLDHEPGRLVTAGPWLLAPGESVSALVRLPDLTVVWQGEAGLVGVLSPDGRVAAFGGQRLTLVETSAPHRVTTVDPHATAVTALAWDARGLRTGGADGRVMRVGRDGAIAGCVTRHARAVRWLGPGGLSASVDGEVRRTTGRTRPRQVRAAPTWVPDARLATGWEHAFDAGLYPPVGDGASLLIAGSSGTQRWRWERGEPPRRVAVAQATGALAIAPAGDLALVSSQKRLVALSGPALTARVVHRGWTIAPRFIDGRHAVVSFGRDGGGLIDALTGEVLLDVGPSGAGFIPPALVVGAQGAWRLHRRGDDEAPSWTRVGRGGAQTTWMGTLDGRRALARVGATATLWRLDAETPEVIATWPLARGPARIAFDPVGGGFALAGETIGGPCRVFDADGESTGEVTLPAGERVTQLALSTAGKLAVATAAGSVFVADPATGARALVPPEPESFASVRWLSDERLVVRVLGTDQTERAWLHDAATGDLVAPLVGPPTSERAAPVFPTVEALGDTGLALSVLRDDGRVRLWDLASGALLGQAPPMTGVARRVTYDAAQRLLSAVDSAGEVWLWRVGDDRRGRAPSG